MNLHINSFIHSTSSKIPSLSSHFCCFPSLILLASRFLHPFFTISLISFNGILLEGQQPQLFVSSSIVPQDKIKWNKGNMCIYNIYKYLPRSNSDHTSPFKGFWSPKVGPLRRKKHKSFIFLHISTIPLLTKVACFLLVCPCFTARGFVLSLSLS